MRDLNFFSQYQEKKQEKKSKIRSFYIAYGLLALVILVTASINVVKIVIYDKDIKEYTEKLNESDLQSKLTEANEVNGKLNDLKKYETVLLDVSSSVRKVDVITDDLLNDICGGIPSKISLVDFKTEGYDVTISGVSTNREFIAEYAHNLKNISKIKNVQLANIVRSNTVSETYAFDITCVLKEVE